MVVPALIIKLTKRFNIRVMGVCGDCGAYMCVIKLGNEGMYMRPFLTVAVPFSKPFTI